MDGLGKPLGNIVLYAEVERMAQHAGFYLADEFGDPEPCEWCDAPAQHTWAIGPDDDTDLFYGHLVCTPCVHRFLLEKIREE